MPPGIGNHGELEEEFEADVTLRDGSLATIRKAKSEDRPLLLDFLRCVSFESFSLRFFRGGMDRETAVENLLPAPNRFALIAMREGGVIGHACYDSGTGKAEAGVLVTDSYQNRGLGTILLGQLAEAAGKAGITFFEALVKPENRAMINVVQQLGFRVSLKIEPGLIRMIFPTSLLPEAVESFERREAIAAGAALEHFFRPKSVAVIGASRDPDSIGGRLFRNIVEAGFKGPVYPVNSKADLVQSITSYRSILDCPGEVDLAIVVVPAHSVLDATRECAKKGVHALVVISSGFSESGHEGASLQAELIEICRNSGIRLIGPNCMGIINTDVDVNLNAQFSPYRPAPGRLGFLSQSGALGIAIIDYANTLGLGMSTFASVGNKADVSGNDLIQYWEGDSKTDLLLLYLETFGNPRKFARIVRRVARKKPVIAVKSGRSTAGFRATQSHTGALVASSDVTVDALFHQSGVIRVDTLEEMFDVASLLSTQPVPDGDRVAIVTNAGGAGILAADACESLGLEVPELSEETQAALRRFVSSEAGVRNPVDMTAAASSEDYARTIRTVSEDPSVDALIIIFIPPMAVRPEEIAKVILDAHREPERRKTTLSTFMASHGLPALLNDGHNRIPSYPFPESAVRALARAVQYGKWLKAPEGKPRSFPDTRREEAAALVAGALASGSKWLSPEETEALLGCYNIPMVRTVKASTPREVRRAATELGGSVALKAVAPGLLHKTEVGAVRLNLANGEEAEEAATRMIGRLASTGFGATGFLVQPMVNQGVEMLVGVVHDSLFGPVVACGMGGVLVELLRDIAVRITPLTERDVSEMVPSLKTFPLLAGYRGGLRYDVEALELMILRVGALVEDIPQVSEMDLNPVFVLEEGKGALVVDARVHVAEVSPPLPLAAKKR